jgi:hypothetical protein
MSSAPPSSRCTQRGPSARSAPLIVRRPAGRAGGRRRW